MAKKFAELRNTIWFAQNDRMDEALTIVNSGQGKQIMDALEAKSVNSIWQRKSF